MLSEVLIPLSMFAAIAVVLWKYFDSRHKIRAMIIERGLIDENLKFLFGSVTSQPNRYSTLKWGLVALFIGISLLVVIPLQQYRWAQQHDGELITGVIFVAGGLAFLIYYAMVSRREKEREN